MPNLKVLGSLCLIDQGELDWKILTIDERAARELGIRDIDDYNREYPGHLKHIKDWFRTIKTYDGKPENHFGYDEQVLSVEKTVEIIHSNH